MIRAQRAGGLLVVLSWTALSAGVLPAQPPPPAPDRNRDALVREALRRDAMALQLGRDRVTVRAGRNLVSIRRIALPGGDPAEPTFIVAPEAFDELVYGEMGRSGHIWERLDRMLESRVREARREWRLPTDSLDKLRLAGRGDLKRMFDRVEERRRVFERARPDVDRFQTFVPELVQLHNALYSINFSEGSLFSKTLTKLLEDQWPPGVVGEWRPRP